MQKQSLSLHGLVNLPILKKGLNCLVAEDNKGVLCYSYCKLHYYESLHRKLGIGHKCPRTQLIMIFFNFHTHFPPKLQVGLFHQDLNRHTSSR